MAELLHRAGRVLLGVQGCGCRVGWTARDVGLCAHRLAVRGVGWCARLFRPHPSLRATFPTQGKAFGAVRGVMWCLLAMEIPPAGAPLGAGFAVRQWLVGACDFLRVVPLRSG